MEVAGLNIKMGADISGLVKGTNDAKKKLADMGIAAGKLDSKLGKDLVRGSNQAGTSLLNLGRVVQDAPYGFIGIANNIDPLLQSFTSLRKETGSTGSAFKALAGSLMGGAGIGLAVSLATSLLVVFGDKLFKAGKSAGELDEIQKRLKESTEGFAKAQQSSLEGVEKQRATMESLIAIAKGDVGSKEQQAKALEKLNKLIPDNIGVLTKQNIVTSEGARIIRDYTAALEAQALAELLINRNAELRVQNIDIENKRMKTALDNRKRQAELELQIKAIQGQLQNTSRNVQRDEAMLAKLNQLMQERKNIVEANNKQWGESAKIIGDNAAEIERYRKEIEKASASSLDLTETVTTAANETVKAISKAKVETVSWRDELEKALSKVRGGSGSSIEIDIPIEAKPIIDTKSFSTIDDVRESLLAQLRRLGIDKIMTGQGIAVPITFPVSTAELKAGLADAQATITAFKTTITDITRQMQEQMASSIGEGLGAMMNGGGIQDLFGGLFQVLGQGLKSLGQELIKASAIFQGIKLLLKNPLAGNPALLAIGGIALTAIGTYLQGLKIRGFADGGRNLRGGLALVGERGPELVNLPSGSDVFPNHTLGSLAGGAQIFIPDVEIRGDKLLLVMNRALGTKNRIG